MRRFLLPVLWVCAFVLAACSAVAPTLRAGDSGRLPWDLGAPGGPAVSVVAQPSRGFQTQQAAPSSSIPATVGDVASYLFELRRTSDNAIAGSFTASQPNARFIGVPDGTYYLRADARNGLLQSLVEGGPQNSPNTVTVATPSVLYSTGGSLNVTLNLRNGQGMVLGVNLTAPYTAGFHAVVVSPTTVATAGFASTVSSLEFRNVLDGTYRAWGFAHDGAGIATPGVASGLATVSGNATAVSGQLHIVTGGSVGSMGGVGAGDSGLPAAAVLEDPQATCVSTSGDIFIAEPALHRIRVIAGGTGTFYGQAMVSGRIYTVVGNGFPGNGGDGGSARSAQLNTPSGIAVDGGGDLFIADSGNNRVRRIVRATGQVNAWAGDVFGSPGTANGMGGVARFATPKGLAFDGSGNLYVADTGNHRIRKIDGATNVTTAAGTTMGWADGLAGVAQFSAPEQLTVDPGTGTVYIADTGNHRIRTLTVGGVVTTLAGSGTPGLVNGVGAAASFNVPKGLVLNATALYVADSASHAVRRIDTGTSSVTTWSGTGAPGFAGDGGPQGSAQLNAPMGMAIQGAVIYIADTGNKRFRQVGINISTLAGNGSNQWAGEDCPAKAARFASVAGLTFDTNGHILLVEENTHTVRIIAQATGTFYGKAMTAGNVYHVAGKPGLPGAANGVGSVAQFNSPTGISCDTVGNVYVADRANSQIRRIDGSGSVTSLVSGLNQPRDVVCSTTAQLYITEQGANMLSKAPAAGGAATSVLGVNWPEGLAMDPDGNVYVAANGNHTVAKLFPNGSNTLVAGTGTPGNANDGGLAFTATITGPKRLAFRGGFLYITTPTADRVRMVAPDGKIYRIAGDGTVTPPAEGDLAGGKPMPAPEVIAVDPLGRVIIGSRTPAGQTVFYHIR